MPSIEEAFAPIANIIIAQVMAGVTEELKKRDIVGQCLKHDRSLTREEVLEKLNICPKTLYDRIRLGTVPPPYTRNGEFPQWSERTIEKYMAGEWRSKK